MIEAVAGDFRVATAVDLGIEQVTCSHRAAALGRFAFAAALTQAAVVQQLEAAWGRAPVLQHAVLRGALSGKAMLGLTHPALQRANPYPKLA